ncbi:MAG: hypothetical protein ACLU6W_04920 [Lachnospiraceae bacterium]
MSYALLGKKKGYTVFQFDGVTIRFRAPYSLEKYTEVKEWDHGYLVVMAKYEHNSKPEEEYIDMVPILENLYMNADNFLDQISEVRIQDV